MKDDLLGVACAEVASSTGQPRSGEDKEPEIGVADERRAAGDAGWLSVKLSERSWWRKTHMHPRRGGTKPQKG